LHPVAGVARAASSDVIEERENFLLCARYAPLATEACSVRAPAFRALDPQHVELADQVAEDDRAVARHLRNGALLRTRKA